ncbi:hypothetical protein GSI_14813 [Ganoderma sinense ZZ0214-1]|uniref:DUF6533 domain-containing protein n=1 Tax=Ganoderma sinense ZZ0214-1 TaxID=1077348 RepID=A0A2G8RPT2_9APHY|nr:hypothetical protein GSI_14813 [Ganoderma sinense ZZ0214-1]
MVDHDVHGLSSSDVERSSRIAPPPFTTASPNDLLAFSGNGVDQHSAAEYDSDGQASNCDRESGSLFASTPLNSNTFPERYKAPNASRKPTHATCLLSPPPCAGNPSRYLMGLYPTNDGLRILSIITLNISPSYHGLAGILYYDYTLTFGMEVDRFWKRRASFASFVFYFNRYLVFLGHIPVLYEFYGTRDQNAGDSPFPYDRELMNIWSWRCSKVQMYHQLLAGIMQVVVAGLQMFRIHALYHGDRRITFALVALAMVCASVSIWSISRTWMQPSDQKHVVGIPGVGCDLMMTKIQGKYLSFAWLSILAYDTAVFGLTLYRALGVESRWRGDILSILLRDGAFYFAVLLVCHLCNIITCVLAPAVTRGVSVTITNVIASSLITRLMLNLRDPHLLQSRYGDSRASELERSELPWRPRTNAAACSSAGGSESSTSSS